MLGGGPVVVPRRRRKRSMAATKSRQAPESNPGVDTTCSRSDPYKRIRTVSTFSWNIDSVAKEQDHSTDAVPVPVPQPAWAAAAAAAAPLSPAAVLAKSARASDAAAAPEQPTQDNKEENAWLSDASTVENEDDEDDEGGEVAGLASAGSGSGSAAAAASDQTTGTVSEARGANDVGESSGDQTLRGRAKVLLTRALLSGADGDARADGIADGIEASLFASCAEVNADYKAKLRSLCASLRRESEFRDAALDGTLRASVIGRLKPQQMASSTVLAQRQAMRESAKKAALLPDVVEYEQEETRQYTCPTCGSNRSRALKQTNGASAAASDMCRKDESKCAPPFPRLAILLFAFSRYRSAIAIAIATAHFSLGPQRRRLSRAAGKSAVPALLCLQLYVATTTRQRMN